MSDIKVIDIAEFRRLGFLQEVNRRFFHPLGLALSVDIAADGAETLAYIWDCRDDPEGITYCEIDAAKVERVDAELDRHMAARVDMFGSVIQPVGGDGS